MCLRAGEFPEASGREVLASFGALPNESGRPLAAGESVRGARRSVGGALRELLGGLGSSFGGSGDNVGGLGIDFLSLGTKFATDFSRGASLRPDESRIHTIRNTQSVTTTLGADFLSFGATFATDFSRGASLRPDESRIHTIRNTQGVTTTSERRLRQPKFATKLAQEKNLSCPTLQNMNA